MARVNVEQKALTDPRFARLGRLIHEMTCSSCAITNLDAHRLGLGHMAAVWNECQERETTTLSTNDIDIIFGVGNASVALTKSELGSPVKGGRIRIRGSKGRVEWLGNKRRKGKETGPLGAEFGKLGGRPKKPVDPVSVNPLNGLGENPPPAPAPAPAPALKEEKKTTPSELKKKSAQQLVEELQLDSKLIALADSLAVVAADELEAFKDRMRTNGYRTNQGPVKDAAAAFRTHLRNAPKFGRATRQQTLPRVIRTAPLKDE